MMLKMGHSQPRLGPQIGPSAEDDISPMISHISNKITRMLWVSKMAPFRELITAEGCLNCEYNKGRCRRGGNEARCRHSSPRLGFKMWNRQATGDFP